MRQPRFPRPVIAVLVLAVLAVAAGLARGLTRGGGPVQQATGCVANARTAAAPGGSRTQILNELTQLRLVSYYPADAAWTNMWTDWQPARIDGDLCGIARLGANAVRIIVQPRVFGYPAPAAAMEDRLRTVIGMAASHGLRVQLTLFDWWSDYADTQGSDVWARALLRPFRGDSRIAFCELKNEINVDDVNAMSWARHELPVIRAALGSVPVTISVSGNSPVISLSRLAAGLGNAKPDFYDVHYYGAAGAAYSELSAARAAVAPVPLYVGETGASSQAPHSPGGDAQQDLYLRAVEWAAHRAGLPVAAPWMYTDLTPSAVPPGAAADPQPTATDGAGPSELYFGLIRSDGSAKPAAQSVREIFAGDPVPLGFNNGFGIGHGGLPDDWQTTENDAAPGAAASGGTFAWDSLVGHYAPGSARISATPDSPDPVPAFYTTPVTQPTHAGEKVRLTVWVKGEHATGSSRAAISWFADDGSFVREDDSPSLDPASLTWTKLSVAAAVPPGAVYTQIRLQSEGNSGTVWFDDVSFTAVD